jgi:hypothetical protein
MKADEHLVQDYFAAWLNHDIDKLQKLFISNCEYEIKNKRKISGIKELIEYWERNKKRQRYVDVFDPIVLEQSASYMRVAFCATFLDVEERQHQTVFGEITFKFSDQKISSLSEKYDLRREKSNYVLWEEVHKAWSYLQVFSQKNLQKYLPKFLTVTSVIIAFITFYFYYGINRLPMFVVCLLNGQFNMEECGLSITGVSEAMVDTAYRVLGIVAAFLLITIPFVSMYSARIRFGRVRTTELNRINHDLELMRERYKGAKGLTIFSGDFSFVRDHEEFFQIFKRLINRNALRIISDASKAHVIAGFGGTPEAESLIEKLELENRILFESPTPIKCSIVRKWDGSEVLYRFDGNGAGPESSHLYMCEVKRRGDIAPVVDLIEHLSKARLGG